MSDNVIKVLLVEDNRGDARLIWEMLREVRVPHIEVEHAERLSTGLKCLTKGVTDVVLLDLSLPDGQGFETFSALHAQVPQVPVILLTGLDDEAAALRAVREGAQDYLVKGQVDGNLLVRAIRYAIERKQAEQELQASKESFRNIVEKNGDGILVVDQNGVVLFANPALESLLGCMANEISRDVLDLRHLSGNRIELDIVRHGDGVGKGEIHVAETEWQAKPAYLLTLRDITDRKGAEEEVHESNRLLTTALDELNRTQRQIIQQERLSALGQMASGIAHDLNNTLTPILGFSRVLLKRIEGTDGKDTEERYLRMINMAAQDAATVVSHMRDFYRNRDEGEMFTGVSINDVVEHAISLTHAKLKDEAQATGITITVETDLREVPLTSGNESELREVLTNLILNATDAMPDGGTLSIRTHRDGEHVVVEVNDTGTGMTEEVRQNCFEPFFTTKGTQGTGMGLAMAYGIVQRHAGKIDIETEPGKGTAFVIRLPVQTRTSNEEDGASTHLKPTPTLRVLLVDDEPMVLELVAGYLTADGHTVETATNGREGLDKFPAGTFDLVVTDRAMPGMNGDQLAAAIKREAPRTPVIMLTGFGDVMKSTGEKPGCVDLVIGKPITEMDLRQAVAEVATEMVRREVEARSADEE